MTKSKTTISNKKTSSPRKSKIAKKKHFLIRKGEDWILISQKVLEEFTPEESHQLACVCHAAQRAQLLLDAARGDHYVGDVRIVEGLEESLDYLEKVYPGIRQQGQIVSMDAKIGHA